MKPLAENEDFELVPASENDEDYWNIRILTGDFVETVIKFKALMPVVEDGEIRFSFDIVFTPDFDLTESNVALQEYAARILSAIIPDTMEV